LDIKFHGFLTHGNYILAKKIDGDLLEGSQRSTHDFYLFFPLEKAYDRMPTEVLWKVLEKKGIRLSILEKSKI